MTTPEYQAGYYSLIQFCPNLSRMETANVGVVLLVPGVRFVKARVASAYAGLAPPHSGLVRVLLARGGADSAWLNDAARGVAALLEAERESCLTTEGLALFAAKMANDLLLTPPRPVKVRKPETELNRLFEELVLCTRENEPELFVALCCPQCGRPVFPTTFGFYVCRDMGHWAGNKPDCATVWVHGGRVSRDGAV